MLSVTPCAHLNSCLFRAVSLFFPALSLSSTLPESCNYFPTSFATSVKISRTFLCLKSFSPTCCSLLLLSLTSSVSFCSVLALNINGAKVFIVAHSEQKKANSSWLLKIYGKIFI